MNRPACAALIWLAAIAAGPAVGQMVSGPRIPGFGDTFGVDPAKAAAPPFKVQLVSASVPGNVLWPGDALTVRLQLVNLTDQPLRASGRIDVIAYGTRGRPGDVWVPQMFRIGQPGSAPLDVNVAARGHIDIEASPPIPERFGAYGLVVDLGQCGRRFLTSCVRTFAADTRRVQFPKLGMDVRNVDVLRRLGCKSIRHGLGYKPTTDKDFEDWFQREAAKLAAYNDANVTVILEFGGGTHFGPTQPLGRPRPWLDESGTMKDTKFDLAWLPSYDDDFTKFCYRFAAEFGWPNGPVVACKLWNEPWEGISISGWGADMLRYRDIYMAMCKGVEQARRQAGAEVLVGGCDSSSNTFDKFFADGSTDMLKWLDFCSIHYQGMAPPSTVKAWVDRRPRRVLIWDTESWVANCDDRVAAVIATNMSTGHDRAVGVYGGNICTEWHATGAEIIGDDGKKRRIEVTHTWSVAAAVAAAQHFIGERQFRQLLFKNGLPWVMVFDGLPDESGQPRPEDGTVVVVGDIGEQFGHDWLPMRTARGLKELANKDHLRRRLAALPADAPAGQREELLAALARPETLSGATMTLTHPRDLLARPRFALYDFYGNPVPPVLGRITVPLDGRGFFLRGDGRPGSFEALLEALRRARIEGIEPLATVCHDLLAPVESGPTLRLTLTNVLNRPVKGVLTVRLGELRLNPPSQVLDFRPHETKAVALQVTGGEAVTSNTYPLALEFDAGKDGRAVHAEDMHVNLISRRTITVDGRLDDWQGVLPQPVAINEKTGPTLTELAWQPFREFDQSVKKGFATGYLAYDAGYFYFAAKIADDTPDEGMPRFETRDDDEYFYPEKCYVVRLDRPRVAPVAREDTTTPRPLVWPEGVRRYSYRKAPELPSGNSPNHDNVQIGFNVLPDEAKPWYTCPPGTMPGYVAVRDTDYEYALNPVAARYGGGTEIWRLAVPGMPHKHFYPRQPKSPRDGPVRQGRLFIRHDGGVRIVEAALPWSELPDVRKRLDAGQTVKFTFRVNDNAGKGCMELARGRSVSRRSPSLLADWVEHWANQLEFAFEK